MTDTRELSQPSTSHHRRQRLIVTPANSLPLEVRNHEPERSLEESFATGKYVGSFKLRFQRNTKRTAAADMSDVTTDDDCEVELKEAACLVDEDEASTAVTIVTTILDVQQSHHDDNTTDPLSAMEENQGVEPQNSRFAFLEEEPLIHAGFRNRAQKAVKAIADEILQEVQKPDEEEECCQCLKYPEKESSATLTPQLKRASSQGFKMLKKFLFPSLPKFLQDLWVGAELAITIIAFIFGVVGFSGSPGENNAFDIFVLSLSTLSFILALIDGFIYFFQLGALAECVHTVRGKLKERKLAKLVEENGEHEEPQNGLEDDQQHEPAKKWWQLSPESKEKFDTWFELVRNLTSEAILYPLLVCDLFGFIAGGTFEQETSDDSVDFGFFVVGNFYLIVAVYFMRLIMVFGSLVSLRRMPMNSSGSTQDQQALMGKFLVHILAQIIVHAAVIAVVAVKIADENVNVDVAVANGTESFHVSPFLWVTMVLGGIVPFSGVLVFFLANYFWLKELSVSFWIDMMSLLQSPSFADTVFDHDTEYKDKTLELIEKTEFGVVKDHFSIFKSTPYHIKFLYPLKIPILVVLGILYEISLIAFMVSIVYSTDPISGDVRFVLLESKGLTSMFFIMCAFLVISNVHILILVNLWLVLMLVLLVAASITVIVATPFIIFVYLPLGLCTGYMRCVWELARKVNIYEVEHGSIEIMMEDLKP